MAHGKRLTDTSKWDGSFYQELPSDFKCVWEYMLDHVDSIGVCRVSFKNLNHFINPRVAITREEFDQFLVSSGKVMWLSDEKVWMPGYIAWTYGKLRKTGQHLGIARKVVELTENLDCSLEGFEVYKTCLDLLGTPFVPPTNPVPSPTVPPYNGTPRYKDQDQHQHQDQDQVLEKGGVGEKTETAQVVAEETQETDSVSGRVALADDGVVGAIPELADLPIATLFTEHGMCRRGQRVWVATYGLELVRNELLLLYPKWESHGRDKPNAHLGKYIANWLENEKEDPRQKRAPPPQAKHKTIAQMRAEQAKKAAS